jgi:hypothetical protein
MRIWGEPAERLRQLKPDIAATDDNEVVRQTIELQRADMRERCRGE